jgi:hypothetical protein
LSRLDLAACVFAPSLVLACGACSGAAREAPSSSDTKLLPETLRVLALPGGNGVLEVTALTLRNGPTQPEIIAALRNTGDVPACHAAFAVELFDAADRSLAAGITGLLTQQFYRRTDGSAAIAACVAPGERTIGAITDLPAELAIEDVATVFYRSPYYALDVAAVSGLTVERVERVARSGGTAYAGTLVNTLDVSVDRPSVTVFPVNHAGRPLGVAVGASELRIPAGGTWMFETNAVDVPDADFAAFPAGALSR